MKRKVFAFSADFWNAICDSSLAETDRRTAAAELTKRKDPMSLGLIYYLEINIVCMIILGILLFLYSREKRGKAESPWYKALLWSIILYCIADIIAIIFRGRSGSGVRAILWTANTIYVTLPLLMVVLWGKYTRAKSTQKKAGRLSSGNDGRR